MLLFDGVHLTSDTSLAELLRAAKLLRLRLKWLQISNGGVVHFDLVGRKAAKVTPNCKPQDIVRRGLRRTMPGYLHHRSLTESRTVPASRSAFKPREGEFNRRSRRSR
jgi:hypothetical protein